jgi:hypothetical protein
MDSEGSGTTIENVHQNPTVILPDYDNFLGAS